MIAKKVFKNLAKKLQPSKGQIWLSKIRKNIFDISMQYNTTLANWLKKVKSAFEHLTTC